MQVHPDAARFQRGRGDRDFAALLFPNSAVRTREHFDRLAVEEATRQPWLRGRDADLIAEEMTISRLTGRLEGLRERLCGTDKRVGLMQRCVESRDVSLLIELAQGEHNHYLSQHRFCGRSRRASMLAVLQCLHLDLDFYSLGAPAARPALESDTGAIDAILTRCAMRGIPYPTQVVRSGRGLYVRWLLDHVLPAQAVPRWRAVQRELHAQFTDLGSDPKALDCSRVLRVVGSVHQGTGHVVKMIYNGPPVAFDDMARSALDRERLSAVDRVMTRSLRQRAAGSKATMARRTGLRLAREGWCAGVYFDLRRLIELRGERNDGHRQDSLAWAANFGLRAGILTPATALAEMSDWALLMPRPDEIRRELAGGCLNTIIARARKGEDQLYRPRRTTLIERLSIEPSELAALPTLGRRTAVPKQGPDRRQRALDMPSRVLDAARRGLDVQQISTELALSPRQVQRHLRSHKFA
jgi:hypothetical protein